MNLEEFGSALLAATDNRGIALADLVSALKRCEVKTDPRGRLHELAALSSPALLGHMALLERTKRSATCMTKTPVRLAVLSRDSYDSLLYEPSGAGRAMRRLLLASLAGQLSSGNERLRKMLEPSESPEDDAETETELVGTTATLEGLTSGTRSQRPD